MKSIKEKIFAKIKGLPFQRAFLTLAISFLLSLVYLGFFAYYGNESWDWLRFDTPKLAEDVSKGESYQDRGYNISRIKNCQKIDSGAEPAAEKIIPEEFIDTDFRLVNILEQSWEDSPALALVFSKPLADDPTRFLSVVRRSGGKNAPKVREVREVRENGRWILSPSRNVAYFPFIESESHYTVMADRGIKSINQEKLPRSYKLTITTEKRWPSVNFISCGSLFSPELAEGMPIRTLNVSSVQIDFWKIHPSQVLTFFEVGERDDSYELQNLNTMADLVYSGSFKVVGAEKNQAKRSLLNLKGIKPLSDGPGLYFMVMRGAEDYPYRYATSWFSTSEIGVQVRMNRDRLHFFAHSFLTSEPISGAGIDIFFAKDKFGNKKPVTITADKQGFAEYLRDDKKEVLALVKAGNGFSVISLNQQLVDLGDYGFPIREQKPYEFFMYGPRNLYRPGEKVKVNGILRDHLGKKVSIKGPLQAKLIDPAGVTINEFRWSPQGDMGFYTIEINTEPGGLSGKWILRAEYQSEIFEYPFLIEDFIPEKFRITLTPEATLLKPDQEVIINTKAAYLYGSPASGNNWQADVKIRPVRSFGNFLRNNDNFQKP